MLLSNDSMISSLFNAKDKYCFYKRMKNYCPENISFKLMNEYKNSLSNNLISKESFDCPLWNGYFFNLDGIFFVLNVDSSLDEIKTFLFEKKIKLDFNFIETFYNYNVAGAGMGLRYNEILNRKYALNKKKFDQYWDEADQEYKILCEIVVEPKTDVK